MDDSYLLDILNEKQREAVAASRTNMQVLAGAGGGKARVLGHRIAWPLSVEKCSPYSLMAGDVTKTKPEGEVQPHRLLPGAKTGGARAKCGPGGRGRAHPTARAGGGSPTG